MKKTIKNIVRLAEDLYFIFSVEILKRRLGIENAVYLAWHRKRAKRLQIMLDIEHGTNIASAY